MSTPSGAIPHGRRARRFQGTFRTKVHVARASATFPTNPVPAHWHEGSATILLDWLRSFGADLSDVSCDVQPPGEPNWPRNIPWKTLPVVGEPSWDQHEASDSYEGVMRADGSMDGVPERGRWRHRSTMLLAARAIVIDAPDLEPTRLCEIFGHRLRDVLECGAEPFWFDGSVVRRAPVEALRVALAMGTIVMRLDHNLSWNLSVLMGRAMRRAAREEGASMDDLRRATQSFSQMTSLGIQILYDLLDGDATAPRRVRQEHDSLFGYAEQDAVRTAVAGWKGRFADGVGDAVVWRGTGAYAPLRLPIRRDDKRDPVGSPLPCPSTIVERHVLSGLVGTTEAGDLALTPFGRRVMEILGRAVRDPDLVLRWRGRDLDAVAEVDRWLNRSLRRTKRRLAGLAPAPGIEIRYDDLPDLGPRYRMVWGYAVGLPAAVERSARQQAVHDAVVDYEARMPFADRAFGLCRTRSPVVDGDPVTGIWYGVPLGIMSAKDAYHLEPVDPARMIEIARRNARCLNEIVVAHGGDAADVDAHTVEGAQRFTTGLTRDPEARFVDLAPDGRPTPYL